MVHAMSEQKERARESEREWNSNYPIDPPKLSEDGEMESELKARSQSFACRESEKQKLDEKWNHSLLKYFLFFNFAC